MIMIKDKVKVYASPYIETSGTCLQGHIRCDYHRLVQAFGQPSDGDGYKVDAEWNIQFVDGDQIITTTIYNFKNGRNYNGDIAPDKKNIFDWNIGGYDKRGVLLVHQIIDGLD